MMDHTTSCIESLVQERKSILKSLRTNVVPAGERKEKQKRAQDIIRAVKIMNSYSWDIKKYIK